MARSYRGAWRVTVVKKAADWDNRVLVRVRGREIVIPGRAGAGQLIDAPAWEIELQHNYGAGWRENVRTVPRAGGRNNNGLTSELLYSKDHDWPGDTVEENIVIRLDQVGNPYEEEQRAPATSARTAERPGIAPAARVSTVSGGGGVPATPAVSRTVPRTAATAPAVPATPATAPASTERGWSARG
ncbi:hypothetical protein [Kitasatospora sp. GAS1066B]|uniref:hypothetical protein n=1 Tax=Kitasatospora sp. GAS1066B TaxID=3156271 RepID=UPI003511DE78